MHACNGCRTEPPASRAWHGAFVRWYDADRAGHRFRARLWGFAADLALKAV